VGSVIFDELAAGVIDDAAAGGAGASFLVALEYTSS